MSHIKSLINNLINQNSDAASLDFHLHLKNVMTEVRNSEPNYQELKWQMDKWLPNDPDLMHDYHEMMDSEDRDGLIDLFTNEGDYNTMIHYGGKNLTVDGFVDWLIASEK